MQHPLPSPADSGEALLFRKNSALEYILETVQRQLPEGTLVVGKNKGSSYVQLSCQGAHRRKTSRDNTSLLLIHAAAIESYADVLDSLAERTAMEPLARVAFMFGEQEIAFYACQIPSLIRSLRLVMDYAGPLPYYFLTVQHS